MWLAILLVTAIGARAVLTSTGATTHYSPSATATDRVIELAFATRTTNHHVTVIRNGHAQHVAPDTLVVGDLVCLRPGDLVPADGLLVAETVLTLEEGPEGPCNSKGAADPWCLTGSRVWIMVYCVHTPKHDTLC